MAYRIRGTVLPGGDIRELFIVDGRISFTGVDDADTLMDDGFLLPGLVDAHAHLSLASPAPDDASARERAEASAAAQLDAGVLLIREPGSPDHASEGIGPDLGLPRVLTAGRFLAPPDRYFPGLAREVGDQELPDAAVEELSTGSGWAKVIGDSPFPGPGLIRTFTRDAMQEAAARVHEGGGRIAIHCTLAEVVQDAIEVGFDSLEHASFMQPDQLDIAIAKGVAWVPTLSIDVGIREMVREMDWPAAMVSAIDDGLDRQPETLRAAAEAGMTILAGTDAGMGPHGMVRHEVELMVTAGLPASTALGAASWTARSYLGFAGIEEGAPADIVAFRDDPREGEGTFLAPALTILDGRLVDDPR